MGLLDWRNRLLVVGNIAGSKHVRRMSSRVLHVQVIENTACSDSRCSSRHSHHVRCGSDRSRWQRRSSLLCWNLHKVLQCKGLLASCFDHFLHFSSGAQQQFQLHLLDLPSVGHHSLPCILIRAEGNEGIPLLSTNDVNSSLGDGETLEILSDVEGIGRPRQVLKSDDHTHRVCGVFLSASTSAARSPSSSRLADPV